MLTVAGNVGNAEYKTINTSKGESTVLNFSVAENFRDSKGEKKTNWYRTAIFGRFADSMKDYIKKGTIVQVSGTLDVRQYDRKDGGAGVELNILNPSLTLLGGNKDNNTASQSASASQPVDDFVNVPDGLNEELPFA